MEPIKNIIFDFDGTLADTATVIVATMTATFRDFGIPVPSEDEMRQTIGMKLKLALAKLGNLDDEAAAAATEHYKKIFMERGVERVALFPEVASTLKRLKEMGIRLAIATSRNSDSLQTILKNNGIDDCFDTMTTNSDNLAPKPDPEMVLVLLERMGKKAGETLVVGDTTFDIEMGNRAGCRTCAVTWGNHDIPTLKTANPSCMIDGFRRLEDMVQRN